MKKYWLTNRRNINTLNISFFLEKYVNSSKKKKKPNKILKKNVKNCYNIIE